MKTVRVKIVIDIEADTDERGRIDRESVKENLIQALEEQIEVGELDFEYDDSDEDEDY